MTITYNHMCLAVTNCLNSTSFYERVLQGEKLKSVAGGKVVFLRLPGGMVLELFQKISDPPEFRGHLAFQVENAKEARLRICDMGIECTEAITRASGNTIFLLRDPDGHEIEMIQHAEGMDPLKWSPEAVQPGDLADGLSAAADQ